MKKFAIILFVALVFGFANQAIAKAERRLFIFHVKLQCNLDVSELPIREVDQGLNQKNFPVPQNCHQEEEFELRIFRLQEILPPEDSKADIITYQQGLEYLKKLGYRAANVYQFVSFLRQYWSVTYSIDTIAAFGSVRSKKKKQVLVLGRSFGSANLSLHEASGIWEDHIYYVGVRPK